MNLVKIADLLKNAPDQSLMQEMQNPTGAAPSYMILSELQRRKKLRGAAMNPEPQTSVAEDLEAETSQANQMGTAGLGSMAQQPQMQPRQAPVGMAAGGEVQGYATGDYVDGGGYPSDPSENTFWPTWEEIKRRTGYGRMLPPTPAAQPAAAPVMAPTPQVAPQVQPQPKAGAQAAGIRAAAPAQKQATAENTDYSVNPLLSELKDYRKQMADAYKQQADVYKQQAEEIKNTKATDVGLALMQAGFGIAGGRSQNAIENIGQGAMPAIQQYAGMDRARREQLQKLALGQGALGIEQLGAQMKGVTAEGELGLGGEKMDIARRSAAADEMRARAVANQASQWKQENASDKLNLNRATEIRNYLDKMGLELSPADRASLETEYRQLMKVGTMGGIPQGVKVTPIK